MSESHHDLVHEFPLDRERIHALKARNAHFLKLANEYHDLQKQLHRIEAGLETPGDLVVERLKKERLRVKDAVAEMLSTA